MDRKTALALVEEKVTNKNLVKHCLAAEACMKKLAVHFGEDADTWALAGLLHDLDYEETKNDFSRHGPATAELLKGKVDKAILNAIVAHAGQRDRETLLDKALYAVDPITGLIVASALIRPEQRLSAIDAAFVLNRFEEKRFAAGADRDQIRQCEMLGLSLEEFSGMCLSAMQEIAPALEL